MSEQDLELDKIILDAINGVNEEEPIDAKGNGIREEEDQGQGHEDEIEDTASEEASEEEEPTEELEDSEVEVEDIEPEEAVIDAPQSWTAEMKAKFGELSDDVREYILQREKEFNTGIQQKSQELAAANREYEPLKQVLAPYEQQLKLQGMSAPQAVQQLFALQQMALSNPRDYLRYAAQQLNVDLQDIAFDDSEDSPAPKALTAQDLDQRLTQFQQQQAAHFAKQEAQKQIDAFKADKPHFDEVSQTMASLIQSGVVPQGNLAKAYDMALKAHGLEVAPTTQKPNNAVSQQELSKRKAKALKAKKASGPRISAGRQTRSNTEVAETRSLDEDILASFLEVSGQN